MKLLKREIEYYINKVFIQDIEKGQYKKCIVHFPINPIGIDHSFNNTFFCKIKMVFCYYSFVFDVFG